MTEEIEKQVDVAPESKEEETVLDETKKETESLKENVLDDVASKYTMWIWKEYKENNGSEPSLSDIAKNMKGSAIFDGIKVIDKLAITWEKISVPISKMFNKIGGIFGGESEKSDIVELSTSQRIFKEGLLMMLNNPAMAPKLLDQMNIVGEIRDDLTAFAKELDGKTDVTKLNSKLLDLDTKLAEVVPVEEVEEGNGAGVIAAAVVPPAVALAGNVEKDGKKKLLISEIESSPYEKSGKSTLCSGTVQKNAKNLFGIVLPSGDAIEAQNIDMENDNKDGNNKDIDSTAKDKFVGTADNLADAPEGSDMIDIYIKSNSKFGHRALGFLDKEDNNWYLLDPYRLGKSRDPILLSEYQKKGNKIVKYNFYNTDVDVVENIA